LDVTVKRASDNEWNMIDLLGRSMGQIREDPPQHFTIYPDGQALETMADLKAGPYASLDAALTVIETHTRGVCRLELDQMQS
jgi:predicted proteasome-type protease